MYITIVLLTIIYRVLNQASVQDYDVTSHNNRCETLASKNSTSRPPEDIGKSFIYMAICSVLRKMLFLLSQENFLAKL